MDVHHEVAGNDDILDMSLIDLVLDQISDETDPFFVDSYLIYYIGCYKPFATGNEETAKVLADGILADFGYAIPQTDESLKHLEKGCNGNYSIDSIVEWQQEHAYRI